MCSWERECVVMRRVAGSLPLFLVAFTDAPDVRPRKNRVTSAEISGLETTGSDGEGCWITPCLRSSEEVWRLVLELTRAGSVALMFDWEEGSGVAQAKKGSINQVYGGGGALSRGCWWAADCITAWCAKVPANSLAFGLNLFSPFWCGQAQEGDIYCSGLLRTIWRVHFSLRKTSLLIVIISFKLPVKTTSKELKR